MRVPVVYAPGRYSFRQASITPKHVVEYIEYHGQCYMQARYFRSLLGHYVILRMLWVLSVINFLFSRPSKKDNQHSK